MYAWRLSLFIDIGYDRICRAQVNPDHVTTGIFHDWSRGVSLRSVLLLAFFADVQFQLPAVPTVARDTPDFQRSNLGNAGFKAHGQHATLLPVELERYLKRAQLFDLFTPIFQKVA